MDYAFYQKLKNSTVLQQQDVLDQTRLAITSPVTMNLTYAKNMAVGGRFNEKYLPYTTWNVAKYNGDGANGDSDDTLIVNMFDISSVDYTIDNAVEQYSNGFMSAAVSYRTWGTTKNAVFMNEQNTNVNSTTGDNILAGDLDNGNLSLIGPVLYGGKTAETKNIQFSGMIHATLAQHATPASRPTDQPDRILLIGRKFVNKTIGQNEYHYYCDERVYLDYNEWDKAKIFDVDIVLGKDEWMWFGLFAARYDPSIYNYSQGKVGTADDTDEYPYIVINKFSCFFKSC